MNENWAQPENAEVEAAKAEFEITKDPYADAQAVDTLRQAFHRFAVGAVKYSHVDRDWLNTRLAAIGAEPITGRADYRINVPVTGLYGRTIKADSRLDAVNQFNAHVARVQRQGRITTNLDRYDSVYSVEFADGVEPTFASGPEDPPVTPATVVGLEAIRTAIRDTLMAGVAVMGWDYGYAIQATKELGLEPLPVLLHKTLQVPVTGTATLTVPVFEGDTPEQVQVAAEAAVARSSSVAIKPVEVGDVTVLGNSDEDSDEPY